MGVLSSTGSTADGVTSGVFEWGLVDIPFNL